MAREMSIELVKYRSLKNLYTPQIGDIIIKHGFIQRTKWMGVINDISKDGMLYIIKDSTIMLLVTTSIEQRTKNVLQIPLDNIRNSICSSYSIMQQNPENKDVVWYV